MGSYLGSLKIAAAAVGVSAQEYLDKRRAGLKRCRVCKEWLTTDRFAKDRSRGDGLKTKCRTCGLSNYRPSRPSLIERRKRYLDGLKWCDRCSSWVIEVGMRGGRCSTCASAVQRERYATDALYRSTVKARTQSRRRGMGMINPGTREAVLEWWDGLCAYCGKNATSIDHIIPIVKGGSSQTLNLVAACARCNSSKNDRDVEEFLDSIVAKGGEFNPKLMEQLVYLIYEVSPANVGFIH